MCVDMFGDMCMDMGADKCMVSCVDMCEPLIGHCVLKQVLIGGGRSEG